MELTQALTLVPERKREEEEKDDIGSARMSMDSVIHFLTSPVRDMPLLEFDLPKILSFYSKKGKEDSDARDILKGVREFISDAWEDGAEEEGIIAEFVESFVGKAVRRVGFFIARVIWGTIWRVTKWLVKEIVGGVVKNLLRWLIAPILEAVAGFMLTPVGLAIGLIGGAAAAGWLIYKAFFEKKTDAPKSEGTDELEDTTSVASNLLRQPEGGTMQQSGATTAASMPTRTSEGSLTTAEAPMPAGGAVAAGPPPSDVKKMIIQHEGIRLQPYKDSLGLWTIGVGHLIGDGHSLPDSWNRTFSQAEVMALFDQDYEVHKKAAMAIPNFSRLGEKAQAAFIDLTFNMGAGWYRRWPKLLQAMRDFDIASVISNLRNSKWAQQVQASRVSDVLSLLSTELTSTSVASQTPKMVPGTTTAATTQNQVQAAQDAARPGVAINPVQNQKTILKTPSGQLVAANM
jgi:lysozyme